MDFNIAEFNINNVPTLAANLPMVMFEYAVPLLTEWWIGGFPALVITLVVIAVTLIGDSLNDLLYQK